MDTEGREGNFINYWFCDTQNVSINNEIIIFLHVKYRLMSNINHCTVFESEQSEKGIRDYRSLIFQQPARQSRCCDKKARTRRVGQMMRMYFLWAPKTRPRRSIFNYQLKSFFDTMMMFFRLLRILAEPHLNKHTQYHHTIGEIRRECSALVNIRFTNTRRCQGLGSERCSR